MANIKLGFKKGTQSAYEALSSKDSGSFYLTENNVYLGDKKLTNSTIGLTKDATGLIYSLTVDNNTIGTINIPKDMVVTSGEVVVDPADQAKGTYIKLTIANVDKPLYINVGSLVDIYTGEDTSTVELSVDQSTRKITANIADDSIEGKHIKKEAIDGSIHILGGSISDDKLTEELRMSIDRANSEVTTLQRDLSNESDRITSLEGTVTNSITELEGQVSATVGELSDKVDNLLVWEAF